MPHLPVKVFIFVLMLECLIEISCSLTSLFCRYARLNFGNQTKRVWASSNTVQGIFRATQFQPCTARPTCSTQLEGQKALEEIDRLEKATLSHLSSVLPIRGLQCCCVAGDNIIKHERLPSLWAFMASVSIFTVFHGWVSCPLGLRRCLAQAFWRPDSRECELWRGVRQWALADRKNSVSVIVRMSEGPSGAGAVETGLDMGWARCGRH